MTSFNTDILLVAAAAVVGLWPQIARLLGIGGKSPQAPAADLQSIVAEILRLLQHQPPGPPVPVQPVAAKLTRDAAVSRALSLESDLRAAGFVAAANAARDVAASLLVAPEAAP